MKAESRPEPTIEWRMTEQRFTGTPGEVSAQIDQLVLALIVLRRRLDPESGAVDPEASRLER